ncbi:hypothetical protein A0H81_12203 [Grifola frondosa]|uniref:Uncharacterized protein n=1 Tax=Grifola frondosa TaxID=5627 RepID=A0A1C7LUV1_GRIFR|nr:hypothetical protein A0H81_12203 [Grifola frondosa]
MLCPEQNYHRCVHWIHELYYNIAEHQAIWVPKAGAGAIESLPPLCPPDQHASKLATVCGSCNAAQWAAALTIELY